MNFSHKAVFLFLCIWDAKADDPLGEFCNTNSNISTGGKISANIDKLLAELALKTPSTGFAATTYGKDQDKVYALAQCKGDVSAQDCSNSILFLFFPFSLLHFLFLDSNKNYSINLRIFKS